MSSVSGSPAMGGSAQQQQQQQTTTPPPPPLASGGDDIPIRLTLGGASLAIGARGEWTLEHSALQEATARTRALEASNARLAAENAQLRDKCARLAEEANMDKFKCQLLVEMLALASLDEERSKGDAEREKAKAASVQRDMLALLAQARREGLDAQKIALALEAAGGGNQRP